MFSLFLDLKDIGSGWLCTRGKNHSLLTPVTAFVCRVRRILFKIESVHLPVESELSSTVKALCLEFKQQHLAECRHTIESDKRYEYELVL